MCKLVIESIDDLFKSKSSSELQKNVFDIIDKFSKFVIDNNDEFVVFRFDTKDDLEQTERFIEFTTEHFDGVPFSLKLTPNSKTYVKGYERFGPFYIILDKISFNFYMTQLNGFTEVIDSKGAVIIRDQQEHDDLAKKYKII